MFCEPLFVSKGLLTFTRRHLLDSLGEKGFAIHIEHLTNAIYEIVLNLAETTTNFTIAEVILWNLLSVTLTE